MSYDPLTRYKSKRNFSVTSEPAEGGVAGNEALTFVIQKHWASHLHYDFRLQLAAFSKAIVETNVVAFESPSDHVKNLASQRGRLLQACFICARKMRFQKIAQVFLQALVATIAVPRELTEQAPPKLALA